MFPRNSLDGFQAQEKTHRVSIEIKFTPEGLVPAIVQEATGHDGPPRGRVLMFAWINAEALEKCKETGLMHYWSRSRKKLWLKGETSGHTQRIVRWFVDCDADVLLFEVEQSGGACHTGYQSCFFQQLDSKGEPMPVLEPKVFDDHSVYSG
jgi:phosphoribosyl-AMP cyclohydrolase